MRNKQLMELAIQKLTPTELRYFKYLNTQYLVPFIKGKPGIGKTAILESIAEKLGMVYIDLRLPTVEETDMGLYPVPNKVEYQDNGKTITINKLAHAAPEWAVAPIENPTLNYLIVFEELNRASQAIRNAAMGVVLERRVGFNLRFKENVFMAATGNLGDKDGTEVEELDFAQKDRFIILEHKEDLHAWINDFARLNVHPSVIKYLEHKPGQFYPDLKEQNDNAVITPRKWTGFSRAIEANTERGLKSDANDSDFLSFLNECGKGYIGDKIVEFTKFVMEGRALTVPDVFSGRREKDYPGLNRDNKNEVLHELKGMSDWVKIKTKESKNLGIFLQHMRETDHDMLVGFIYDAFNQLEQETKDMTKEQCLKVPILAMLWNDFRTEVDLVSTSSKYTKKESETTPEESK